MRLALFFSAAIHSFLISSEIAERDELGRAADPSVPSSSTRLSPRRRSSASCPYCCLMETGTQTNEQPLPGSALRLFINRDAEALLALIFQAKRRLVLAPARRSHQRGELPSESGTAAPAGPICAGTLSLSGLEEVGGKLDSAGNLRSSCSLL